MLGSVIYEHKNPDQQSLLVQDLKNNDRKEYPIDNNMNIRSDSHKQSLDNILSDDNRKELDTAIRKQKDTSFTLSDKELANVDKHLLSDQRYNDDQKEGDSLKQLKHLYQSYQSSLKQEATGELTQEKVADRMKAENSYKTLKENTIKENPDMTKSIGNMEYNVKQKNKQNSNEQTM